MSAKKKQVRRIQGTLVLDGSRDLDQGVPIKVATVRDQRVLQSQVVDVEPGGKKDSSTVRFALEWDSPNSGSVRLVVGPDVPDDRLLQAEVHQQHVSARSFDDGATARVKIELARHYLHRWRRVCRTYRVRGRLICRRWVLDPATGCYRLCEAPVRGAEVKAFDVDHFWWWFRRDQVGTDITDANGFFEIEFRWCCLRYQPWFVDGWTLSPEILGKIREVADQQQIPLPEPSPDPDPLILQQIVESDLSLQAEPSSTAEVQSLDFLGRRLVSALPDAADLLRLRVWPFYPFNDCRPDLVFEATQDCGEGVVTVYQESVLATRWDIDQDTDGIVLLANDEACCGPFCEDDPPTGDCLAIQGAGCGSYPIESIEQDPNDAFAGYGLPGTQDRPFGGTIPLLGVFGDGADVDYYKPQRRRLSPAPTPWADVPSNEIGNFTRNHWIGPPAPFQIQQSVRTNIAGQTVLETVKRFRDLNGQVVDTVTPTGNNRLCNWVTAAGGAPQPGLIDGVYELRFIGYRYDQATDQLVDDRVMPICPGEGEEVDPLNAATLVLRLDNRVVSSVLGSVHLTTSEPNCDFPNDCAVVINENPAIPLAQQLDRCVQACGFARLSAGDTLTIHFSATDSDDHLGGFNLFAHWGESQVFNVLSAGVLAADPHIPGAKLGPRYAHAMADGAVRPDWRGGHYAVTVPASAFVTCCAYQLDLRVWKRTTNGCISPVHFHNNRCQFSFTVIREDLIGDPNHPSCTEICSE